jgi:predicted  nucleic acid-binding Zn-ribbon protein
MPMSVVATVHVRWRSGCFDCGERLENFVPMFRAARNDPGVSALEANDLILEVELGFSVEDESDCLVFPL